MWKSQLCRHGRLRPRRPSTLSTLLERFHSYFSIDGLALSWHHSYLSNRSQYVKLSDHTFSELRCTSCRGSPWLGPRIPTPHPCLTSLRTSTCLFQDDEPLFCPLPSPSTVSPINLTICGSAQMPLMTCILSIFSTQPAEI